MCASGDDPETWPNVCQAGVNIRDDADAQSGRSETSVVLTVLGSDEPVKAEAVGDLPVGCAPGPPLHFTHDPATFGEAGEPVAQNGGRGDIAALHLRRLLHFGLVRAQGAWALA